MPYAESELLPISALQHLLYCERQCALIHIERLWAENLFTAEGNILHKKAHSRKATTRPEARTLRALPLRSFELGLCGVADIVQQKPGEPPLPVEYKRGRPKKNDCDRVQLCAQALCLEEMTQQTIPRGELFYGKTRRRVVVEMTQELRDVTTQAARRLRLLVESRQTPLAVFGPKCERCSLQALCLPRLGRNGSARQSFDALLATMVPQTPLAQAHEP
jgi:CRISPR-associated exonuclease Cas4